MSEPMEVGSKWPTVVVDPPWQTMAGPLMERVGEGWQWNEQDRQATRPLPYETMSVGQMVTLPVDTLAAPDAHLYLWTTNGYLGQAFELVRHWGFRYSTTLVWAKTPMGGGLGSDAYGIATEYVLFARRGKLPARNRIGRTWFNWKRPYDERGKPKHSAKPPAFFDMVEHVSPGPWLEMFSRADRPRMGWAYHGDESLQTAEVA